MNPVNLQYSAESLDMFDNPALQLVMDLGDDRVENLVTQGATALEAIPASRNHRHTPDRILHPAIRALLRVFPR